MIESNSSGGWYDLPTPEEQQAEYQRKRMEFERAEAAWIAGGRVGPPPPHPVRPHTPGWAGSQPPTREEPKDGE